MAICLAKKIPVNYIFVLISIIFAVITKSSLMIALLTLSILPLTAINAFASEECFLFTEQPIIVIFFTAY